MSNIDPEIEGNTFYNDWIPLHKLPEAEETEFTRLESEYLYVRLSNVIVLTILGGLPITIFTVFSSLLLNQKILIIVGFLILMGLWAVLVTLEFRHRVTPSARRTWLTGAGSFFVAGNTCLFEGSSTAKSLKDFSKDCLIFQQS